MSKARAPKNLVEAIARLKTELDASALQDIERADASMRDFHFGVGSRIRNDWALWSNDPLPTWFVERGVPHPDDMSEVILRSLWRDLHGLPPLIDEEDLDDPPPVEMNDPFDLVFSGAHGDRGVVHWLKDLGDAVEMGDVVASVTTSHGVVHVRASATGSIGHITIDEGEACVHGDILGGLDRS